MGCVVSAISSAADSGAKLLASFNSHGTTWAIASVIIAPPLAIGTAAKAEDTAYAMTVGVLFESPQEPSPATITHPGDGVWFSFGMEVGAKALTCVAMRVGSVGKSWGRSCTRCGLGVMGRSHR